MWREIGISYQICLQSEQQIPQRHQQTSTTPHSPFDRRFYYYDVHAKKSYLLLQLKHKQRPEYYSQNRSELFNPMPALAAPKPVGSPSPILGTPEFQNGTFRQNNNNNIMRLTIVNSARNKDFDNIQLDFFRVVFVTSRPSLASTRSKMFAEPILSRAV